MNALQVFSSDIIPVYTTDRNEKVVIGRELHERLGINSKYADWFKNMCAYGFSEDVDYTAFSKNLESGGRSIEHVLSLDMAKHIAMIQRTPQGFAIRQKLIELEKAVQKSLTPTDLLELQVKALRNMERSISATNARIDQMKDTIALNTQSWREDCRRLIVRIAQTMGGNGFIRDVQSEIFKLVDSRAGVSLATRLTNKRQRMADEGVCKSKRDRLTKTDIIADDKKLIEIYTAIVKEMAVKYLEPEAV